MPTTTTDLRAVSGAIAQLVPNIVRGIQLDFFIRKGVTQTQFLVLMAIHASTRCSMKALAQNMHVTMPTASGVVDRLVRGGYVRRCVHPQDRRHVLVVLTRKGEQFIVQYQAVVRRRWEDVLSTLRPHELDAFYRVVTALRQRLEERG